MKVVEIAFTCYPVTDLPRSRNFYEGTLGLRAERVFGDATQGWVEYDIGPATLSLCCGSPDWKPSAMGPSAGLEVEDFAEAMDELARAGHQPRLGPIETPVCYFAIISDPDGNSITLHKRKSP